VGSKHNWNNTGIMLDFVKARKLAYCSHTMRKQRELPGERLCKKQCMVEAGKEDHIWLG